MTGKKTTIIDVARRSGVSTATVSRVLNGGYPVSQALRERVLEAVRELHYTPNQLGKSLKTRRSGDLGVIVPNMSNPYYAMLLGGIYDVAVREGYQVILCNAYRNPELEARSLRGLLSRQVDGLLLASINPDRSALGDALRHRCPVVAMDQTVPGRCLQVHFDSHRAGYIATEHLALHGHRRIGFIGAPLDRSSRREMLEGYRDCLRVHDLECRKEDVMLPDREEEREQVYELINGAQCARVFAGMPERPTGYVCVNDLTALGAMRAFADSGLQVPDDVSVVGCDNIPYCTIASPALTSVETRAGEMGAIAVRLLLERIEHPEAALRSVTLSPALIARDSVGRAR